MIRVYESWNAKNYKWTIEGTLLYYPILGMFVLFTNWNVNTNKSLVSSRYVSYIGEKNPVVCLRCMHTSYKRADNICQLKTQNEFMICLNQK